MMDRRELLGVLGATAAGLAAGAKGRARDQDEKGRHEHGDIHGQDAEACVDCAKHRIHGFHHSPNGNRQSRSLGSTCL